MFLETSFCNINFLGCSCVKCLFENELIEKGDVFYATLSCSCRKITIIIEAGRCTNTIKYFFQKKIALKPQFC